MDRLTIRNKILQWCPASLLDEYDQFLSQETVRDEALEFYANPKNYDEDGICGKEQLVEIEVGKGDFQIAKRRMIDKGKRARAALKREPNAAAGFYRDDRKEYYRAMLPAAEAEGRKS